MILDSNVIIRFLRNDVAKQTKLASDFINKVDSGEEKGEISILVLDEIIYVLGTYYHIERSDFIPALVKILAIRGIEIIETKKENIIVILNKMIGNKIDFTDYYLAAISKDKGILSFDEDLKKLMSKQVE